jgi:translation initiation factor 2B subunit (eIF-2B alpha/beta/delta family)
MQRVDELYQTLLVNNESGSSELLRLSIEWVQASLQQDRASGDILEDLQRLRNAHPAMALLRNFTNFVSEMPLNHERVQNWSKLYSEHEAAACMHFANHLSAFTNILVHSYSGLLHRSLMMVEKSLNIFCTESRPVMEGRRLAEKLSKAHHKVFLISDMAAFSVIQRVEILAFGCDSITPRGIINKIGTAALAEFGQRQGRMNCFIGTTEKVLGDWDDDFLLRQGPREEIYSGDEVVQVENYYFDLTPSSFVGRLFLETGNSRIF